MDDVNQVKEYLKQNKPELVNKISEIERFMNRPKPALTINHLDPETKEVFLELAKKFNNDYGVTLAWILDRVSRDEVFFDFYFPLEERVRKLEGEPPVEKLNKRWIEKKRC